MKINKLTINLFGILFAIVLIVMFLNGEISPAVALLFALSNLDLNFIIKYNDC